MVVHRPDAFFARLATDAKIGFGEAYMAGDWDTGPGTDLADLLTPLASNVATLGPPAVAAIPADSSSVANPLRRRARRRRRGRTSTATTTCPTTCSRRSSTRRSATPRRCSTTATISPPPNVARSTPSWTWRRWGRARAMLEIGTGWGQLAIQAAQRGAHVTTVTLSTEQRDLALRRVAARGRVRPGVASSSPTTAR